MSPFRSWRSNGSSCNTAKTTHPTPNCKPSSTPVTNDAGQPLRTTRHYSPEIGTVLAEVEGAEPSYRFTGDELYVLAVVTSDELHPNPHQPGDVRKAWTQPVVVA